MDSFPEKEVGAPCRSTIHLAIQRGDIPQYLMAPDGYRRSITELSRDPAVAKAVRLSLRERRERKKQTGIIEQDECISTMRAPAAVDSGVSALSGCGLPKVQIRVLLLVLLTTPLLEPLLEPAAPAAPAVEVSRFHAWHASGSHVP
jgi:hypothetical protein